MFCWGSKCCAKIVQGSRRTLISEVDSVTERIAPAEHMCKFDLPKINKTGAQRMCDVHSSVHSIWTGGHVAFAVYWDGSTRRKIKNLMSHKRIWTFQVSTPVNLISSLAECIILPSLYRRYSCICRHVHKEDVIIWTPAKIGKQKNNDRFSVIL